MPKPDLKVFFSVFEENAKQYIKSGQEGLAIAPGLNQESLGFCRENETQDFTRITGIDSADVYHGTVTMRRLKVKLAKYALLKELREFYEVIEVNWLGVPLVPE